MIIEANKTHLDAILDLLGQVNLVHHLLRPDIFKIGTKYNKDELINLLNDEKCKIFVYVEDDKVLGYAFTFIKQEKDDNILTPIKSLYIDDLCVDNKYHRKQIGTKLFNYVSKYAKEIGCYNLTLNVYYDNKEALEFYKKVGLNIQKIGMEKIL